MNCDTSFLGYFDEQKKYIIIFFLTEAYIWEKSLVTLYNKVTFVNIITLTLALNNNKNYSKALMLLSTFTTALFKLKLVSFNIIY